MACWPDRAKSSVVSSPTLAPWEAGTFVAIIFPGPNATGHYDVAPLQGLKTPRVPVNGNRMKAITSQDDSRPPRRIQKRSTRPADCANRRSAISGKLPVGNGVATKDELKAMPLERVSSRDRRAHGWLTNCGSSRRSCRTRSCSPGGIQARRASSRLRKTSQSRGPFRWKRTSEKAPSSRSPWRIKSMPSSLHFSKS